jgi:hypothetical protein
MRGRQTRRPTITPRVGGGATGFVECSSIDARWEEPCAWRPAPCVHAHAVMHSTPWEWGRDRVIADPPRQAQVDSLID